jgi:hypothetical protein
MLVNAAHRQLEYFSHWRFKRAAIATSISLGGLLLLIAACWLLGKHYRMEYPPLLLPRELPFYQHTGN